MSTNEKIVHAGSFNIGGNQQSFKGQIKGILVDQENKMLCTFHGLTCNFSGPSCNRESELGCFEASRKKYEEIAITQKEIIMEKDQNLARLFFKNPGDGSLGGCLLPDGEHKCLECSPSKKTGCLDVIDSTNSFFLGTFPGTKTRHQGMDCS